MRFKALRKLSGWRGAQMGWGMLQQAPAQHSFDCLTKPSYACADCYPVLNTSKVMSGEGLEPSRLPTRPSNVRVYQFRHPDMGCNSLATASKAMSILTEIM